MLHLTARDELRGFAGQFCLNPEDTRLSSSGYRGSSLICHVLSFWLFVAYSYSSSSLYATAASWRGSTLLAHSYRLRAFYDTWGTPQCYNQDDETLLCQLRNLRKWKVFLQTPSRSSSHFQKLSSVPSSSYRNKPLASPAHKAHIRPYHSLQ